MVTSARVVIENIVFIKTLKVVVIIKIRISSSSLSNAYSKMLLLLHVVVGVIPVENTAVAAEEFIMRQFR